MKRVIIIILMLVCTNAYTRADANYFNDKKCEFIKRQEMRQDIKTVKKIIQTQNKLSDRHDYQKMYELYDKDFMSADQFNKDIYFNLIKDTWDSYSDITYTTEIKNIEIKDNTAKVDVYETSLATATKVGEQTVYGELKSCSSGTYYLTKKDGKWVFINEKIDMEKTYLKYGDTRFVNMELDAPQVVKQGEYYTSTLKVDTPKDAYVIASIGHDNISYPQEKSEEVYRNLPEDNILERMFYANKSGKNEYNVASIGLAKARKNDNGKQEVYMAGIAFLMTRVNVEAEHE